METPRARLLLRAEIHAEGRVIVGHTTELSSERVFVQTWQRLPVGSQVGVILSFPRLIAPIALSARVLGTSAAANPGDDHGIALGLDPDELYPTFRWYLFDGSRRYAAPVTVFGPLRAALYLGQLYLVLTSAEHVRTLSRHFDVLIRNAEVQPTSMRTHLTRLRNRLTT